MTYNDPHGYPYGQNPQDPNSFGAPLDPNQYGAPQQPNQYGAPHSQYGAPQDPNQYGGQPPYGAPGTQPFAGPPPYGATPPPGKRGNGLWIAVALVAVLVLAVGAVVAVFATRDDSGSSSAAPSGLVPATASQPSGPPPTSSRPGGVKAQIPGFQPVPITKRNAVYDVPPRWEIAPDGAEDGFGDGPDKVVGNGAVKDGELYCPTSTRTLGFVVDTDKPTPEEAASDIARRVAQLGFNNPSPVIGKPEPLRTTAENVEGTFMETTGPWTPQDKACKTASFSVYTCVFKAADKGFIVMVIAADRGVPEEVDPALARKIFTSMRELKKG